MSQNDDVVERMARTQLELVRLRERGIPHTEHCLKRMAWGDGECECGATDRHLAMLAARGRRDGAR